MENIITVKSMDGYEPCEYVESFSANAGIAIRFLQWNTGYTIGYGTL